MVSESLLFLGLSLRITVANGFRTPYVIDLRPSAEFEYEPGRNKLASLRLRSDAGHLGTIITPGSHNAYEEYEDHNEIGSSGHYGKLLRLAGRVDLESRLTVGCCGAVLAYLSRRKAFQFLPGDVAADSLFRVSTIEMFSLNNTM